MTETETRTRLAPATALSKVTPLPPRPRAAPAPTDTAATTHGESKPTEPTRAQPTAASSTSPQRPMSQNSSGGNRPMSFTTPLPIREALRGSVRQSDATVAEVVLGAVADNLEDLTQLVAAERPADTPARGPFPDAAAAPARTTEPRATVSLRLTAANLDVLNDLAHRHHADNRSQLITAALRASLTPKA